MQVHAIFFFVQRNKKRKTGEEGQENDGRQEPAEAQSDEYEEDSWLVGDSDVGDDAEACSKDPEALGYLLQLEGEFP
jgi:hypothetical protein